MTTMRSRTPGTSNDARRGTRAWAWMPVLLFLGAALVAPLGTAEESTPPEVPGFCHLALDCVPCVSPNRVGYVGLSLRNLVDLIPPELNDPDDSIRERLVVAADERVHAYGVFWGLESQTDDEGQKVYMYRILGGFSLHWNFCQP